MIPNLEIFLSGFIIGFGTILAFLIFSAAMILFSGGPLPTVVVAAVALIVSAGLGLVALLVCREQTK